MRVTRYNAEAIVKDLTEADILEMARTLRLGDRKNLLKASLSKFKNSKALTDELHNTLDHLLDNSY